MPVAAIAEAQATREQVDELARLLGAGQPERPPGVVGTVLLYERETATLQVVWRDRDTMDRYLSTAERPFSVELMGQVGLEPVQRVVECLVAS